MSRIASIDDLPQHMREQARVQIDGRRVIGYELTSVAGAQHVRFITEPPKKPRKYRNVPVIVDGQRFDSRLESRCYEELKLRRVAGEIAWFIRQVPFALPGGIVYRADFLAVLMAGGVEVTDAKGFLTRSSDMKIRQVEEIYGIKVKLWPERGAK